MKETMQASDTIISSASPSGLFLHSLCLIVDHDPFSPPSPDPSYAACAESVEDDTYVDSTHNNSSTVTLEDECVEP